MDRLIQQALEAALKNWGAMAGTQAAQESESEEAANAFEASFYTFIDAVRVWARGQEQLPATFEDFLELEMLQDIMDLLPAPLLLNFETEAELIFDNVTRIDDEKYD